MNMRTQRTCLVSRSSLGCNAGRAEVSWLPQVAVGCSLQSAAPSTHIHSRKAQGCTADAQCCAYHVSMSKDRLDGACTVQCSLQLSMVPPVGQPQGILEDGGLLKDVDCWAGCCDGAQRVSQATRTDLQCGGVTNWLGGLVPAWSRVATLQIGLCRMDDAAWGPQRGPCRAVWAEEPCSTMQVLHASVPLHAAALPGHGCQPA